MIVFCFSFVCAPDFFKNKNTIETIQTNTILRAFIAKTFMARSIEFVRRVMKNYVTIWLCIAAERSDLAHCKFCNILIDTVLSYE